MRQYDVLNFIPVGQENAVSMSELAFRMGCDKRTARKLVFNARCKGAVICSTCFGDKSDGYYLPASVDEAIPYVKMQRARILSAAAALKSAEEYIDSAD